jgi:glycosyltransferase involved in cell wall biosynthesis
MNVILGVAAMDGVHYHRLLAPYLDLQRKGLIKLYVFMNAIKEVEKDAFPKHLLSEKYDLDENNKIIATKYMVDMVHTLPDELLAETDVFVFSRNISPSMKPEFVFHRMYQFGIKTICDMDDSPNLDSHHILATAYRKMNTSSCIITNVLMSSAITCTTPQLKRELQGIVKAKKRFDIVKNAIDLNDDQWNKPLRTIAESDRVFGWMGGVTHEHDLKILAKGYNLSESKPKLALSGVVSGDAAWDRVVSQFPNAEFYPPKSIGEYADLLRNYDVALAPLKDTKFNRNKSELKMLEAAAVGIPIIVSDVYPYKNLAKSGHNCIAAKNTAESWANAIDLLAKNTDLCYFLAHNLQQDVNKAYNFDRENEKRFELMKDLCKSKD